MTGPTSPPESVIFDFDGLILDTEQPEYLTIKAVFEEHGVELVLDEWLAVLGRADQRHWLDWLEDEVGGPIEREVVHARRLETYHALVRELEVLPGVVSILDQADALGVPALVASSSARHWVAGNLERLGLLDRFAGVFSRDDVVRAKPWPDLYLAAAGSVGATPSRSIAFEDSYHGSKAAEAAGMPCVAVPNPLTRGQDFGHCALVVTSLADVDLVELTARIVPGR